MEKMRGRLAVFSPLLVYLAYVWHLAARDGRPFLVRWLEGCFALFVALVFCNLIRRAVLTDSDEGGGEPP